MFFFFLSKCTVKALLSNDTNQTQPLILGNWKDEIKQV